MIPDEPEFQIAKQCGFVREAPGQLIDLSIDRARYAGFSRSPAGRDRYFHPYPGFHGHADPQEVLRVLALLEHDFHRDSLHHLDIVPGGISGGDKL